MSTSVAGNSRQSAIRETIKEVLLPDPGVARTARDITTEACIRWNLESLIAPACITASELVTNAVVHAGTMIDMTVVLGIRNLVVLIGDASRQPAFIPQRFEPVVHSPRMRLGLGLRLVEFTADRWGCWILERGKVVWAAFRIPARKGSGTDREY